MYEIVEEKMIRNITNSVGQRTALILVHIVCDTAADMPEPLPHWISGSRCDVLENGGSVYLLSSQRTWTNVNFYNQGGEGGGFDPDAYYTKPQTDAKITEKVAEIVADAPEDFDTLKEMSDWIASHEESAAAMNSAIQQNTTAIAGKVDKVAGKGLSTNDYTTTEKNKLDGIEAGANKTIVDSTLDSSSTNPVQNKVIKEVLDNKVDKVSGKGLSTEDYTTAEKTKLADLENYDDAALTLRVSALETTVGDINSVLEEVL